ncbi:MAG: hypothetical protein D6804_07150, partial [Aquificota bacterium]
MAVEEKHKEYIIRNFYDILQALRENPDWAHQLTSLILTYELLRLPQKFDRFVEEGFRPLARRVERLEEGQKRLERDVAILKNKVSKLEVDVVSLEGDNLERKVRERAPAYFGRYFRRVRAVPVEEWSERLEDAVDGGLITEEERKDAISLYVLIRAKIEDGRDVMLAVEVSYTLEDKDAERALKRAKVISKVYNMETIPVVGVNIPEVLQERHPRVLVVQAGYD